MKISKIFRYGLGILAAGLLLASCSSDYPMFTPTNEDVSFFKAGTIYSLDKDHSSFIVTLQRGVADQALTVALTFEDENNLFTPAVTSVTFAEGEYSKEISLSYDYTTLEPGIEYPFTFSFNSDLAGPGGWSTFNGTCMMKLEYEKTNDAEYYGNRLYIQGSGFTAWGDDDYYGIGDTPALYRAKGGGNADYYYLLHAFGVDLEFRYDEAADLIYIASFIGYNDFLSKWSASSAYWRWDVRTNGNTYSYMVAGADGSDSSLYTNRATGASAAPIGTGDILTLQHYGAINNSNVINNGYYTWILDYVEIK